jgi:glycosyltransferase involved in cell wall biosynthesis
MLIQPLTSPSLETRLVYRQPEVAIVLCTYNRPEKLKSAIEDIIAQDFQGYRVIVIDDGSDTAEENSRIIEGFNDSRIEYFQIPENKGVVMSRNTGTEYAAATGARYICFHDDDDLWVSNRLTLGVQSMQSGSPSVKIGMSYGRQIHVDNDGELIRGLECNFSLKKAVIVGMLKARIFFPCQTVMFDVAYLKLLRNSDNNVFRELDSCEDTDLALRALVFAGRSPEWGVKYIDSPMATYRNAGNDALSGRPNKVQLRREAIIDIINHSFQIPEFLIRLTSSPYASLPQGVRKHIKRLLGHYISPYG